LDQAQQADLALNDPAQDAKPVKAQKTAPAANGLEPQAWPATLPDQVRAVAAVLAGAPAALSLEAVEAHFKSRGAWKKACSAFWTRWRRWAVRGARVMAGAADKKAPRLSLLADKTCLSYHMAYFLTDIHYGNRHPLQQRPARHSQRRAQ